MRGPLSEFRPWVAILLMAAVRALIILLTFYAFDLLAVIMCIGAPTFWSITLEMIAQPAKGIHEAGMVSLVITAVSLLVAARFLL
jgi:hypothetical protein